MITVRLWGALAALADDQSQVDVEARDIRELFRKLGERYPALRDSIENDIAVSIDGVIYRDNWSKELPEGAEIFLMRRLAGG
ncbi:MoaD/ThiS family protein [Tropicimonas sp. IMCC6043]|uniref:MoaD/ThiS family protein n=1 Tax=Tropicimonas sp. IMCC6043 TaxID=2510645 RepID=UPI00101B6B59|nr:MoaD/ThiS family protein [Tropicimonas sp. IMCC6043]RYH05886.1 MoaD/ThiS family protein [Tropicimonas sp. IMCC6043]